MPTYSRGEVVLAYVYWEENGVRKIKIRPCIVIEALTNENTLIKCTTTNRSNKLPGIWVEKDSPEGKQMGLEKDSFINFNDVVELPNRFINGGPIGTCPFMKEIDEHLGIDED